MNIFATYAPTYWAAGLPVIPLRYHNKMPEITQWSRYGREMPTELEQTHWLASYPQGNIGLPLGTASGVCIIDIDDESVVDVVLECLPKSPWIRVGKKGMAIAYKFEGQRNFKLRGADGGMVLEFLGLGNQCVMPPSIHPDTQKPYTANCNLWEVLDDLPYLGEDIEDKLRALLDSKGVSLGAGGRSGPLDVVPAGERDVQMIRHAGYLARVVLGIDRSQRLSLAEAITHMHTWVTDFTANVRGDRMDPDKGTAKLLEFLLKDLEKGRTMPEGWDAGMPEEWRNHPSIAKMFEMNASARWDVERARTWLAEQVADKPNDDKWALQKTMELVEMVAKDENFSKFEMSVLVTAIIGLVGKSLGLKKSDLMTLWKDAKSGANENSEQENHSLIAEFLISELQKSGEIRYYNGQFWQWNGSCFSRMERTDLYKFVTDNVKESVLVRTHNAYNQIISVMENKCAGKLEQGEEKGINFANGFVGEDLVVVDHDPKYGATFTLPFNYDRDSASKCARWFEFLHSCWGHESDYEDRVKALQEMFAATMFRIAPRYQRAFLLFGKAGTGKTQVLNVLRAMLPADAIADLGPERWGDRFGMTDLIGKAANLCGELPESGRINGARFKQVVEGSPFYSEFKGVDGFTMVADCAHWFASNFIPQSSDSSRGFARRWHILKFDRVVPDEEKIDDLAHWIVAEEREAIAAWALEGLRRLLDQRGYTEPKCHVEMMARLRRINNSVQAFIEDSDRVRQGGEAKCRDLYDQYVIHMRDVARNGPVTFERFHNMLEDLDYTVERRTDPLGQGEFWVIGLQRNQ